MTGSGYAPFNNTEITFRVAADWQEDPETGNWEPVETEEVYRAALKQQSPPRYLYEQGIDPQEIFLQGRLLSPKRLSDRVKPGAIASCVFQGQVGRLELLPDESTLPQFQQILGQPIRGLFRMIGAGGDGSVTPATP